MKTQCEAVQKGIDENTLHRGGSAAWGWKTEIKRVHFKRVDPTALKRKSCIYYVYMCVCIQYNIEYIYVHNMYKYIFVWFFLSLAACVYECVRITVVIHNEAVLFRRFSPRCKLT